MSLTSRSITSIMKCRGQWRQCFAGTLTLCVLLGMVPACWEGRKVRRKCLYTTDQAGPCGEWIRAGETPQSEDLAVVATDGMRKKKCHLAKAHAPNEWRPLSAH